MLVSSSLENRRFYNTLFRLSLPIILQNFIQSSLSFVDTMIIGKLGTEAIAGVGLANQYFFILQLILFGITGGATIFTSQLWGKKDTAKIKSILGICIICSVFVSVILSSAAVFVPHKIMGVFSSDHGVILLGSSYLKISAASYVLLSVSLCFSAILRSTEEVKIPMVTSTAAFILNTAFSYLLVYGHLGFPPLGVAGAAYGTVISRLAELILLLSIVYKKQLSVNINHKDFFNINASVIKEFFKVTLPVVSSELVWSVGISAYAVAYASTGTVSIASKNIMNTIEGMTWVIFLGIGSACGIMIGNKIGEGDEAQVMDYVKRFTTLGIAISAVTTITIFLSANSIVQLFDVAPLVRSYAVKNLFVMAGFLWVRVLNFTFLSGVLRSGGDTRFCLWIDIIGVWLVGVPCAFMAAKIFHLEVYWIYALASLEEIFKLAVAVPRVISKKWIHPVMEIPLDQAPYIKQAS